MHTDTVLPGVSWISWTTRGPNFRLVQHVLQFTLRTAVIHVEANDNRYHLYWRWRTAVDIARDQVVAAATPFAAYSVGRKIVHQCIVSALTISWNCQKLRLPLILSLFSQLHQTKPELMLYLNIHCFERHTLRRILVKRASLFWNEFKSNSIFTSNGMQRSNKM